MIEKEAYHSKYLFYIRNSISYSKYPFLHSEYLFTFKIPFLHLKCPFLVNGENEILNFQHIYLWRELGLWFCDYSINLKCIYVCVCCESVCPYKFNHNMCRNACLDIQLVGHLMYENMST